jgi:LemA protein
LGIIQEETQVVASEALWILPVVAAIVLFYIAATYNSLVVLRNHIPESWSNVDTELMRRYELIPNLVAAVKGYAAHERETLERVIQLRNVCMADQGSVHHQEGTERQLVNAVQSLLAVAEDYPDLRANKNFLELQRELVNTEDRIQAARRFYNGNVRDYRNLLEGFPSNLVAGLFNFEGHDFFNVDSAVREAPDIGLGT